MKLPFLIKKLPLEKNRTYLINFLRTGQVQNNFDLLSSLPMISDSIHKIFCLHLV